MNAEFVFWVVLASYLSLFAELAFWNVRSVVSTWAIWKNERSLVTSFSPKYRRIFALNRLSKLLCLGIPWFLVIAVFAFPPIASIRYEKYSESFVFAPNLASVAMGTFAVVLGRTITLAAGKRLLGGDSQLCEPLRLETTGIFSFSRNPGLVGMFLFVAGMWLLLPSPTYGAGILFYVVYMNFKVEMEEDFLANKHGEAYEKYRLQTKRYFG
ncbi:MAG: hypothetical protein GWN81_21495 [Phycisphaerae bacterium]|nr:hypothetical protein [Phycisphaerae bacterium]NIU11357.1 hypothetical protein [Phycisphaerae bacterium]